MKNTITKVIEKGEREFEEKFVSETGYTDYPADDLKSHLRQSQLALLQAVVEGMEKEKVKYENENDYYMNGVKGDIKNVILTDQISSLTTIIKELDNKK